MRADDAEALKASIAMEKMEARRKCMIQRRVSLRLSEIDCPCAEEISASTFAHNTSYNKKMRMDFSQPGQPCWRVINPILDYKRLEVRPSTGCMVRKKETMEASIRDSIVWGIVLTVNR